MYKFFSIDSNYKEMMVMLKSLPTNTIVVDRFGKIIDSNQLALKFLKIKSFDDYKLKRWTALNDFNSFAQQAGK